MKKGLNSNQTQTSIFNDISIEKLLNLLSNSTFDLSGCLRSCSNRGTCPFNIQTQTFKCDCDQYFTGSSCQYDTRPCSLNGQCLHNGLCSNTMSANVSYECKCSGNFTGTNCETFSNVCQSETCSSNGHCYVNEANEWSCKCYTDYSGDKCETANTLVKVVKYAKTSSLVVFLSVICTFTFLIVANDILNIFCPKSKLIKKILKTQRPKVEKFEYHNSKN